MNLGNIHPLHILTGTRIFKSRYHYGFSRREHGDKNAFDGPGGTIAHAFPPTNGRFHYNVDERFSVGAILGAFDYETIAFHEIEHLLGLHHSSIPGEIMESTISTGVTKGLHADYLAGIKALYSSV